MKETVIMNRHYYLFSFSIFLLFLLICRVVGWLVGWLRAV